MVHRFTVKMTSKSKSTREEMYNLLKRLIDIGFEDAADSEDEGFDDPAINVALSTNVKVLKTPVK